MDFDYHMDYFDNYCIWIGILDKTDPCDYPGLLSQFIRDPMYLKEIQKAIQMAREGYIEKSKEKSNVFIFYMKNGDISVLNQEQLFKTNDYNKLYFEATYSINRVIQEDKKRHGEENEEIKDLENYRDYLVSFVSIHVPHLIV
jgi:hypothetical protein